MISTLSTLFFIDESGQLNHENTQLLELMRQCNLSSVAPKLQKLGVTVDVVWLLNDDIISDLRLTNVELLRYNTAKEKYGGQGN